MGRLHGSGSYTRKKYLLLGIIILLAVLFLNRLGNQVYADNEAQGIFNKCAECHYVAGPHRPLGCSSCHRIIGQNLTLYIEGHPSNLINSTPIQLFQLNISDIDDPYRFNEFCGTCHQEIYNEYIHYAHGNTTYIAPNQSELIINGYKNIRYILHIANNYKDLSKAHAKACIECHNPHNPIFNPPSILAKQSYRPPPPDETRLMDIGILVLVGGSLLILIGIFRGRENG